MYHGKSLLPISFLIFLLLRSCLSIDTITANKPVKDGDVLISNEETFALGFFSPGNSSKRYVGIWYNKISGKNVVWVANRDNPINNSSGVLSVNKIGNIVLFESQHSEIPVWSTNVSATNNNYSAQLMDSGNLVLFHGDDNNRAVAWQSFDYPTDTLLPNMKLGLDRRTGLNRVITSWKSRSDPGTGDYSYKLDVNGSVPQLFLYKGWIPYWRAGPWNGLRWSGVPETTTAPAGIFNASYVDNEDEIAGAYSIGNASILSRLVLNETAGIVERLAWDEGEQRWVRYWSAPKDQCDNYGHCGAFSNCNPNNVGQLGCECLPGFEPKSGQDWYLRDGSDECVRKRGGHVCGNGEGFVKVTGVKVPDTTAALVNLSLDIKKCEGLCLSNCSCTGYMTADVSKGGGGCLTWYGEIIDLREFSDGGQDLYLRVDSVELAKYKKNSKRSSSYVKVVIAVVTAAVLLILSLAYWFLRKKRTGIVEERDYELSFIRNGNGINFFGSSSKVEEINERETSSDVYLYSLSTLAAATDNFSFDNKLGEGGFGSIFKGTLNDGQEIAVKRLSNTSGQGIKEFRNEVTLIAKLQHRNLVRLLGYCIEKEEKMLIYEYLPNKGLDCFIFDKVKRSMLDWRKRYDITLGIARGMLYLHQDSRLRIIHRDLKASNILLDSSMNPKISDFGMAKIFSADQMEETTKRVVGTYGYMSPEYAMQGHFSIKSDVFSFGVLLLEIISGRKNSSYYKENSMNLIGHVWDLWQENKSLEVVDSSLGESYDIREVLRCIHIGLLCVQESANIRPTMSEVVLMLCNETALPSPSQPAYIFKNQNIKGPNGSSSTGIGAISVNELTITIIEAR